MRPSAVFAIIWIGWALSWVLASWWSAPTQLRLSGGKVWLYRLLVLAGAILLWHRTGNRLGVPRLWHVGFTGGYLLAAAAFLGICFTWWARIHLGRLWSGSVTRKEGHKVIETGPYAIVRHPIYTGLIAATLASAAAEANITAIAGLVLITAGLWIKARIEEGFLIAELGGPEYESYRRRVPMLMPFMPMRGSSA